MGQRRIVSVNFIYAEGEYDKCDKVLIFVESSERKMEILYTLLAALLYLKIRVREKTPKIREKRKRERCPEYNQILPLLFHRPPDTLDHLSSVHWHLPKREQCLSSPLHFERTDCWLLCSPDTVQFLIRTILQNLQRTLHATHTQDGSDEREKESEREMFIFKCR